MRIAFISDVYANLAALKAFPEPNCDAIWCAGDLVGYGPNPHETIQEIRHRVSITVCGDHDFATGEAVVPQCSLPFRELATETLRYTRQVCSDEDLQFLRNLPLSREFTINSTRFHIVHAAPSDPLFADCTEASDRWNWEVHNLNADVLVVGHTRAPFIRVVGNTTIVNPGSLGQPTPGRPYASYAVWEDGRVTLKEYSYPLAGVIRDVRKMPISSDDQDSLISVLETGVLPLRHFMKTVEVRI